MKYSFAVMQTAALNLGKKQQCSKQIGVVAFFCCYSLGTDLGLFCFCCLFVVCVYYVCCIL